jgi:hypothetical protein
MNDEMPGPGLIAGAVICTAAAGIAAAVLLSTLAKPADFDTRIANLTRTTNRAQALTDSPGDADGHSKGAVCSGRTAADLDAIRASLAGAAARAGLASPNIAITALDEAEGSSLAPLRVTLEADGHYDAVMNLLGQLDRSQPEVFVDSLDLKSKTASVALKLSGKVYCWIVAR